MAGKVSKNMAIGAGVIGFILIGCGLGCAVAGFVWTAYGDGAHGVWSGIFMIIVGVLGAVTLITKSKATIIVFLVCCIIDLIINIIQAIIAAIVMALVGILYDAKEKGDCREVNGKCYCYTTADTSGLENASFEWDGCEDISAMMAILRAVTAFSVLGIIATFAGSIIGCIGACCDNQADTPGVVVIQQGQQPQVQTTTIQTFQQAPPPPAQQQYPAQQYPAQQYPAQQQYPAKQQYPAQQQYPGDPEMGIQNSGY